MVQLEKFAERFRCHYMPELIATGHADQRLLKYMVRGDLEKFLRRAQHLLMGGKLIEPGYHDVQRFRKGEALSPLTIYPLLLREAVNSILYHHHLEGRLGQGSGNYDGWVHSELPWH